MTTKKYLWRLTADESLHDQLRQYMKGLAESEREDLCVRIEKALESGLFGEMPTGDDLVAAMDEARNATLQARAPGKAFVTTADDVEPCKPKWLSPDRIPLGMLTLIEGDPGQGKSTLALNLAACVTAGLAFPWDRDQGKREPGYVVVLSAEDSRESVIVPRLKAAGADLSKVIFFDITTTDGTREPQITEADMAELEAVIVDYSVRLVIVDPVVAYLPDAADTNSDHSVRRVLRKLASLAERTGPAVLGLRHFRKAGSDNPLYRGGGSIGFIGLARCAFVVGPNPDDPGGESRIFAMSKSNLAPIAPSVSYRIITHPVEGCAAVEWGKESPLKARDITGDPKGMKKKDMAKALILSHRGETVDAAEMLEEAEECDISTKTLHRAAKAMGISREDGTIVKTEDGLGWKWIIPGRGGLGGQESLSASNVHLPMKSNLPVVHLPMTEGGF